MRICIPTEGNRGLEEKTFSHFGSAPFFTIYDTDSQETQVISNQNKHQSHGTCQPLAALSQASIDIVLTNGMGRRAVQLLNAEGVKVYLLNGDTVKQAVDQYQAKQLVELTPQNACSGHGGRHNHQ